MAEQRNEQEAANGETMVETQDTEAEECTETQSTEGAAAQEGIEEPADIRCGSVSYVLTEEQHVTLLQLDRSFPHWPACQSRDAQLQYGRKWKSISTEMQARFPTLDLKKWSKLQRICSRARGRKELTELRRFKDAHSTCSFAAAGDELERKKKKFKKNEEQLMDVNDHLRRKADGLAQQLEQTQQLLREAESRARTEQEESSKTKKHLQVSLKTANRKASYLEKCLKHAEHLLNGDDDDADDRESAWL